MDTSKEKSLSGGAGLMKRGDFPQWINGLLQVLVVVSIAVMYIDSCRGLPVWFRTSLNYLELGIGIIFLVEYVMRILVAPHRWKYILSFVGVIDLLSALPVIFIGLDLGSVRVLKLLRLIRLLKMLRLSNAVKRFEVSFHEIKDELIVFGFVSLICLMVCSSVVYQFESEAQPDKYANQFDALWWGVCTLTTVGFGDMYPVTMMGRLFTVLMLIIGLGFVAVPTGLMAGALSRRRGK